MKCSEISEHLTALREEWQRYCHTLHHATRRKRLPITDFRTQQHALVKNIEWAERHIDTYQLFFRKKFAAAHGLDYVGVFSDNRVTQARKDKQYMIIDTSNKRILLDNIMKMSPFVENKSVVTRFNQLKNYVTEDGTYLLDEWVTQCSDFKNGRAWIETNNRNGNKEYFLITEEGRRINREGFAQKPLEREGIFLVQGTQGYYFIHPAGSSLNNTFYKHALPFSENRAAVFDDEGWHYIDSLGQTVIQGPFFKPSSFSEGTARVVRGVNDTNNIFAYELIDTEGNPIAKPDGADAVTSDFEEGAICALGLRKNGERIYWHAGHDGKQLYSARFRSIKPFSHGFAEVVDDNNRFCIINREGKIVAHGYMHLPNPYGFIAGIGGQWRIYDRDGKSFDSIFTSIEKISDNIFYGTSVRDGQLINVQTQKIIANNVLGNVEYKEGVFDFIVSPSYEIRKIDQYGRDVFTPTKLPDDAPFLVL